MDLVGKGLGIPKEICFDARLSWVEKAAMTKILELHINGTGCRLTNVSLAEFLQVSRNRASEIVSSLRRKGYITAEFERDGNKHVRERTLLPLEIVEKPTISSIEIVGKSTGDGRETDLDGRETPRVTTKLTTKGKTTKLQGESGSLHKLIIKNCETVHGGSFKNYGQQGKATNQLLKTAERMAPKEGMDKEEWVTTYMRHAYKLWKHDEFWNKQAFSPSLINGSTFFDRVMETAKEAEVTEDFKEFAKELFK